MLISRNILWLGLRSCLYCGSLFRNADGLCDSCSSDLWKWQNPDGELFHQKIHKLEVSALFQWVPGKQEVLSRLVLALKGEGGQELWQNYAEEFQRRKIQHYQVPVNPKPVLLIPCPTKQATEDHALLFAKALALQGEGEVYSCLSKNAKVGSRQRKKSRVQRKKTTLELSENISKADFINKTRGKRLVFVDDVVTTGSTALAAWNALEKPRDFAVWALAQRSLSCGASRSLI